MADKRTYAQRAETIKRAVSKRRKRVRMQAIEILVASVRSADTTGAPTLSTFTTKIPKKSLSESQKMVSLVHGNE